MKKTLLSVPLFFLCCWFCGYGQTPDWIWARNASCGNAGGGEGWSIATDNFNNLYFTGIYQGTNIFGFDSLHANNFSAFLTKYDSYGNIKWAKTNTYYNNASYCEAWNVCTDHDGNVLITGSFNDTVSFGAFTLNSHGGYNIFLVKYDSLGNVLWAKSSGGTIDDEGEGVATDASGNIYITGVYFSPSIIFGNDTLLNVGNYDIFLAKYDSSGNVLWAKRGGGNYADFASGVAADAFGKVYITGFFGSSSISFDSITLISAGNEDMFIVQYDSSGNVLRGKDIGNSGAEQAWSIVADLSNNIYITGNYTSSSLSFGSHTITKTGIEDSFIAKYDSSGNALWAKDIGGTYHEIGYSIACDKFGKPCITGWADSGAVIFDTVVLQIPAHSPDPMFIAAFDSSGHGLWGKALASGASENNGVAVDGSGCVYIGGDFQQVNPFIIGNDSLHNSCGENSFVAKLCYSGLMASFTSSSSIFCAEPTHCINFFDQSVGNPTSWHWHFTGATPDTSSLQNPDSICYSAPGTYPVQLIVSNGTTTDTLTVASMIIVGGTPAQPTVSIVGGDTLISSHGSAYQWFLNGSIIAGATDSFYVAHQGGTYSVQITDQYGCQSQSAGMQVGIYELSGGVGIAVYPNPFHNELIALPRSASGGRGEFEFTLFDVTSRVLLHRLFTNQTTINTEHLASGMYFYEVIDRNGVASRGKLVKD